MLYKTVIENNIQINNIFFPTSITIKLTNRCNLNCMFCSQGNAKNVEIDLDVVKNVLKEAKIYGVCEVIYTGGEPLLYSHIQEIIEYGKKLGLHQLLVTNGINLDKYTQLIVSNINNVGISIHGNEEIHDAIVGFNGAYKKVATNIERLTQYRNAPYITLNFTISEKNVNCIDHVISFSKQYGCHLRVARLNKIGRSENNKNIQELIDTFFDHLVDDSEIQVSNVIPACQISNNKKYLCHGCSAGIVSVCIEADASVKICATSNHSFGSMKTNSLYEIWNNQEFLGFRSLKWLPDFCKNCRDFLQCFGGCRVENYDNPYTNSKDCLVLQAIEKFYYKCITKRMVIPFDSMRRINNEYLLVGKPNRIIDEEGAELIKALMRTKDIIKFFEDMGNLERKQVIEFLYAMYKDGLLFFE